MANIYFVKHPHQEPNYGTTKVGDRVRVLWTTNEHRRKFIKHDGKYLTNNGIIDYAPLYFWGEYEPYSCATIIQSEGCPKAIHDDLKSVRDISTTINPICLYPQPQHNGLNTDPYVFGDRFRYICCMKKELEKLGLKKGDVIIFGNVVRSSFCFDTVFVYNM